MLPFLIWSVEPTFMGAATLPAGAEEAGPLQASTIVVENVVPTIMPRVTSAVLKRPRRIRVQLYIQIPWVRVCTCE